MITMKMKMTTTMMIIIEPCVGELPALRALLLKKFNDVADIANTHENLIRSDLGRYRSTLFVIQRRVNDRTVAELNLASGHILNHTSSDIAKSTASHIHIP